MQPPPAWEPDEVTLGFAMTTDENGAIRELPEPIVLATILVAVESERRRLLHVLTGAGNEEVDAVANLFWPLLILKGRIDPEVAIFDGTGVWRRTFRYTLLPPMTEVRTLLDQSLSAGDFLSHMRSLLPYFGHDPGAEVLTVEGFLPVDPPLLFDVLSHSEFRSDPQVPHAGFLPARHEVSWYHEVVDQMHRWLERFEADLGVLAQVRERVQAIVHETSARLEEEARGLQNEWRQRIREATTKAEGEIAELHQRHRADIQRYADAIRQAQTTVAHNETAIAVADALALRAGHRQTDAEAHVSRGKQAEGLIRDARRVMAESRKAIESIHAEERSDIERVIGKVVQLEQESARALGERELFRDEFQGTAADLLQAIDGQVAARSMQKNLLAGYFLPLPSLAQVRVVWFPLWTATLRGPRGVRQMVFPPMQVRGGRGFAGTIKSLFGGVVLPLEPRTAQFDKVLRTTMEESLVRDPWLMTATQELTRAADVLADPDVLQRFQEGLTELHAAGWMSKKRVQEFMDAYLERARRRTEAPPEGTRLLPPGATAEMFRTPTEAPAPGSVASNPSAPPTAPGDALRTTDQRGTDPGPTP